MNKIKTIVITGASSGIGANVALQYAKKGHKLFLFGRSEERLRQVAAECREAHEGLNQEIKTIIADVADESAMKTEIEKITKNNIIDIVIACAGVSAGTLGGSENIKQINNIFATNLNGVINTINPVISQMMESKRGNIAIISSMASIIGISSAPSYSASKGAVRLYSDAIRSNLKKNGINVTTIIPGYIKTPMTDVNDFPMPFLMDADIAAKKIINAIEKNKRICAFPKRIYFILKLLSWMPACIIDFINSKLPRKASIKQ